MKRDYEVEDEGATSREVWCVLEKCKTLNDNSTTHNPSYIIDAIKALFDLEGHSMGTLAERDITKKPMGSNSTLWRS